MGAAPHCTFWTPHISETIRARKLKFYTIRQGQTLFSSVNIFPLEGVQGVQHPYCTKCTVGFAADLTRPLAEKIIP